MPIVVPEKRIGAVQSETVRFQGMSKSRIRIWLYQPPGRQGFFRLRRGLPAVCQNHFLWLGWAWFTFHRMPETAERRRRSEAVL